MSDTTFTPENLWQIKNDAEARYEARGTTFPEADDRCTACGRRLGKNPIMVEVSIDGTVILPGDPASEGPESQGWWNLGSECVKRVLSPAQIKAQREHLADLDLGAAR